MEQLLSNFNQDFNHLIEFFLPRLIFAIVCGALVGVEREVKGKSAGLKTSILICLGSTLFSAIAVITSELSHQGDPLRIASQIVSGIGFIGGGVILQSQNKKILGLTSAAVIWFLGAIGVCIGLGLYAIALSSAVVCIFMLVGMRVLEEKILSKFSTNSHDYFIEVGFAIKETGCFNLLYKTAEKHQIKFIEFNLKKNPTDQIYFLQLNALDLTAQQFMNELLTHPQVTSFNYHKN